MDLNIKFLPIFLLIIVAFMFGLFLGRVAVYDVKEVPYYTIPFEDKGFESCYNGIHTIDYFYSPTCHDCKNMKPYLKEGIKDYNVVLKERCVSPFCETNETMTEDDLMEAYNSSIKYEIKRVPSLVIDCKYVRQGTMAGLSNASEEYDLQKQFEKYLI